MKLAITNDLLRIYSSKSLAAYQYRNVNIYYNQELSHERKEIDC
jgi:hypothetical protein